MYVIMHYPEPYKDEYDKPIPLSVHTTQEHADYQFRWYFANEYYDQDELEIVEVECPDM